ncbi:hypothetical protein [Streptomyces sulphureus]|uniref:hypothetical protein n=1 Tax=Streptomyces sulphureus TaxID=47758 RepID=UPI000372E831|nr:hypothetical protein [Streptomyces sulphureus]
MPTGQLPGAPSLFAPAPFEVLVGRALPGLSPQEVTERCRLAFDLVMQTYGRPLAKMPAESWAFPATDTVVAFRHRRVDGTVAPGDVNRPNPRHRTGGRS